jgi:hypothetical protein
MTSGEFLARFHRKFGTSATPVVSYNFEILPFAIMEKHMFRIAGMLLTALSISAGMVFAQPATKYVDISFNLISPITLHEPVAVNVAIKNLVSHSISIDLGGGDKTFFHFKTITPFGRQIDITNEGRATAGIWYSIHLKPSQTYSQRLLLDELYSFDEPGDYSMSALAKVPVAEGKVDTPYLLDKNRWAQVVTEKARLSLVILPRNEAALRKRCEALFAKLREAHEYSEIVPIAEELSYVRDPIAIPYISKLIEKQEEWSALAGLRRINTDEAWEAMIPIINSKFDKTTAAYAKQILRQKMPEIRDLRIREKIANAVR